MDENTEALSGDRGDSPDSPSKLPSELSKLTSDREESTTHQAASGAKEQIGGDDVAPVSDRKGLRWLVLVANILVPVFAIAATVLFTSNAMNFAAFSIAYFYVPIFAMSLVVAPALFVCTIAAWGPWRPIVRCVVLAIALAVVACCFMLSRSYSWESITFVSVTAVFLELAAVFVSATLVLVWIGSFLRLRLGPPGPEPVRISIVGLMCATAVLGVLVVAKGQVDQLRYQELVSDFDELEVSMPAPDDVGSQTQQQFQVNALSQVMIFGPIVGLYIAICAASYCRWLPRFVVVLVPVALGAVAFISSTNNGASVGMVFFSAMVFILIFFGFWTALCIYVLKLSGWPLSRRFAAS